MNTKKRTQLLNFFLVPLLLLIGMQVFAQNYSLTEIRNLKILEHGFIPADSMYRVNYTRPIGYTLDSIKINGTNFGKDSTGGYTFMRLNNDQEFDLYYSINQDTIFAQSNVLGVVSPINLVYYNQTLRITYKHPVSYYLDSVLVNNVYVRDSVDGYTFRNVISNQNIRLVFKLQTFTITASAGNGGSISPQGDTTVNYGNRPIYKITPNIGYEIDSLIINGAKINNVNNYTFDSIKTNQTIRVTFKLQTFTITASAGNGGSISPQGGTTVNYGNRPIYKIIPNIGYEIDSLIINGAKINNVNNYTFDSIKTNQTIQVTFKLQTFTITASAGNGGSISPQGDTTVNYGNRPIYKIIPNIGYEIDSLIINGAKINNVNNYTFDSIKTNQTIRVTFKLQTFTITASAGNGGSISSQGKDTINYGETRTYTITSDNGYVIDSILINGIKINDVNTSYTFTNVRGDSSIRVTFKVQRVIITSSSGIGGSISPQGKDTINYGETRTYTITPIAGYIIDSILINGRKINYVNTSYTFTNVRGDSSIRVTFKLRTFTITSSSGIGGSISPQGITNVNYGSNIRYTITANIGNGLDSLLVDGFLVKDSTNSYTFKNVIANHSIKAMFKTLNINECPTKQTPNILRVGINLQSDINSFSRHRWYLDGLLKDSTTINSYTPTAKGVYTLLGLDSNGCASNLSKKYYYSSSCINATGRLGNGAYIQSNIMNNDNMILVQWCSEILKNVVTIIAIDMNGKKVFEHQVNANLGSYNIMKSSIPAKEYIIQVLDEKGEMLQISDVVHY